MNNSLNPKSSNQESNRLNVPIPQASDIVDSNKVYYLILDSQTEPYVMAIFTIRDDEKEISPRKIIPLLGNEKNTHKAEYDSLIKGLEACLEKSHIKNVIVVTKMQSLYYQNKKGEASKTTPNLFNKVKILEAKFQSVKYLKVVAENIDKFEFIQEEAKFFKENPEDRFRDTQRRESPKKRRSPSRSPSKSPPKMPPNNNLDRYYKPLSQKNPSKSPERPASSLLNLQKCKTESPKQSNYLIPKEDEKTENENKDENREIYDGLRKLVRSEKEFRKNNAPLNPVTTITKPIQEVNQEIVLYLLTKTETPFNQREQLVEGVKDLRKGLKTLLGKEVNPFQFLQENLLLDNKDWVKQTKEDLIKTANESYKENLENLMSTFDRVEATKSQMINNLDKKISLSKSDFEDMN